MIFFSPTVGLSVVVSKRGQEARSRYQLWLKPSDLACLILAAGEMSFLVLNFLFEIFPSLLLTKNNACLCYRSAAAFVISLVFSSPLVLLAAFHGRIATEIPG